MYARRYPEVVDIEQSNVGEEGRPKRKRREEGAYSEVTRRTNNTSGEGKAKRTRKLALNTTGREAVNRMVREHHTGRT